MAKAVGIATGQAIVDLQVSANSPAQLLQTLLKHRVACVRLLVVRSENVERANTPYPVWLLRASGERPRCQCAAEQGDELAAFHSITEALPMPVSIARPPWLRDRGSQ
jgi:hypothetical protein